MLQIRKKHRNRDWICLALLTGLIVSTACTPREIAPVDIHLEDMCSTCRMAISDKRYAAEFIVRDGDAIKFDDIACLRAFAKQSTRDDIVACFVVDFDSSEWIKAESAYFVQSPDIKTPMQGGIAAFLTQPQADLSAARYRGRVLRFPELPTDFAHD